MLEKINTKEKTAKRNKIKKEKKLMNKIKELKKRLQKLEKPVSLEEISKKQSLELVEEPIKTKELTRKSLAIREQLEIVKKPRGRPRLSKEEKEYIRNHVEKEKRKTKRRKLVKEVSEKIVEDTENERIDEISVIPTKSVKKHHSLLFDLIFSGKKYDTSKTQQESEEDAELPVEIAKQNRFKKKKRKIELNEFKMSKLCVNIYQTALSSLYPLKTEKEESRNRVEVSGVTITKMNLYKEFCTERKQNSDDVSTFKEIIIYCPAYNKYCNVNELKEMDSFKERGSVWPVSKYINRKEENRSETNYLSSTMHLYPEFSIKDMKLDGVINLEMSQFSNSVLPVYISIKKQKNKEHPTSCVTVMNGNNGK